MKKLAQDSKYVSYQLLQSNLQLYMYNLFHKLIRTARESERGENQVVWEEKSGGRADLHFIRSVFFSFLPLFHFFSFCLLLRFVLRAGLTVLFPQPREIELLPQATIVMRQNRGNGNIVNYSSILMTLIINSLHSTLKLVGAKMAEKLQHLESPQVYRAV